MGVIADDARQGGPTRQDQDSTERPVRHAVTRTSTCDPAPRAEMTSVSRRFPGRGSHHARRHAQTTQTDWVKTVLFDRGYLARIRGEAIKVYLVMHRGLRRPARPERDDQPEPAHDARTQLSCPTVIDSLARLEELGLVVSTTHQRGKVKTYYVSDPPA